MVEPPDNRSDDKLFADVNYRKQIALQHSCHQKFWIGRRGRVKFFVTHYGKLFIVLCVRWCRRFRKFWRRWDPAAWGWLGRGWPL